MTEGNVAEAISSLPPSDKVKPNRESAEFNIAVAAGPSAALCDAEGMTPQRAGPLSAPPPDISESYTAIQRKMHALGSG